VWASDWQCATDRFPIPDARSNLDRRNAAYPYTEPEDGKIAHTLDQIGPRWSGRRTPMDLNLPQIMVALVGSGVGYFYFRYGRSQEDWPLVASGLALMTYSYFITSLLWLVGVGVVIAVAPFGCRRSS
jgi:hypothetical protein